MGGKITKTPIDSYRNERYPTDVQVSYLPGVKIVRTEDDKQQKIKNTDIEKAQGPVDGAGVLSKARRRKRSNASPRKERDVVGEDENDNKIPADVALMRKNLPVSVQRMLKEDKRCAKLAMETASRIKEEQQNQLAKKKEMIVAVAWGWGGEGRTGRGTFTYGELSPQLVVDKNHTSFIDVAAGKRHSLLVTNDGLVFSTGEGRSNQLGKKTKPTMKAGVSKPILLQRCPTVVLPSGQVKHGRDLQIVQVQAGAFTSFAREAAEEDITESVSGLTYAIKHIEALLADYPENANLLELRAHLIEESRTLGRRYTGEVLSWGSNAHGQLGLGKHVTMVQKPTLITSLSGKRVRTVAAGKEHVLAVTYDGKLYVWGRGNHGRLGLGDFKDRWEPTLLKAWGKDADNDHEENDAPSATASYRVTKLIGAGYSHSLAIVEDQQGNQHIYCWGKGASGRLGYGRSLTKSTPQLVHSFPYSIKQEFRASSVALGGGHTMVLFNKHTETSMTNPWGVTSRLYAWGCNSSGQLGLDDNIDRSTPQRVWLPEYEVINSIDAGKLHSVAVNVYGEMFTWGRGFFGELGHGDEEYRYKPTKLPGTKVWLKFAGGEHHSMAIAVKHRVSSRRKVEKTKASYQEPNAYLGLDRLESRTLQFWSCPRRASRGEAIAEEEEEDDEDSNLTPQPRPLPVFYSCLTCNMASLCKACALNCHKNHELDVYKEGNVKVMCACGPSKQGCRLLPVILEGKPRFQAQLAIAVQALYRGHVVRKRFRRRYAKYLEIRKEVCEKVWHENIINPIMGKLRQLQEARAREIDNVLMERAREESLQAARYFKLQKVLQVLDAQVRALHHLTTKGGKHWSANTNIKNRPKTSNEVVVPRALSFNTRQQFRQLLREIPLCLHPTHKQLIRWTRDMPAYADITTPSKITTDPDLATLFTSASTSRSNEDNKRIRSAARARRATIGGPHDLYNRLRHHDGHFKIRLDARRRQSFDGLAAIDKETTDIDLRLKVTSKRYTEGVLNSLSAVEATRLDHGAVEKLSQATYLSTAEGSRAYTKFTQSYAAPGLDQDVEQVIKKQLLAERRSRRYSCAAPERLHHHAEAWQQDLQEERTLFNAAVVEDYPARRASWTWRADKVNPSIRALRFERRRDWERESEKIGIMGASNGWDLDMRIPELGPSPNSTTQLADLRSKTRTMWHTTSSSTKSLMTGDANQQQGTLPPSTTFFDSSTVHDPLSLPWPWVKVEDGGQIYYYNQETGESQWELPAEATYRTAQGFTLAQQTGGTTTNTTMTDTSSVWQFGTTPTNPPQSTGPVRDGTWQYETAASSLSSHDAYSTANTLGGDLGDQSAVMATNGEWTRYQSEDGRWWWYNNMTGDYVPIE